MLTVANIIVNNVVRAFLSRKTTTALPNLHGGKTVQTEQSRVGWSSQKLHHRRPSGISWVPCLPKEGERERGEKKQIPALAAS